MTGKFRSLAAAWMLVASALALALAAPAAPARAPARRAEAPPMLDGVNIASLSATAPLSQADRDVAWASRLGAKVVRVEIPWSAMMPRARGQVDPRALAYADRLAADAGAAGIQLLMMVQSTPCWASSAPAPVLSRCDPERSSPANAWVPRDYANFAAFTSFLAARYAPRLAAIEIWNEPDQANQHYLAGPGKAAHYAALLRAAYPAIKAVAPSVPVLGASIVGSNGAFLRTLYRAGIKGYYDGLSVHFYTLTLAAVRSIREVQQAAGDTAPLWLDEFGWSSCWPHYRVQQEQACVTAGLQATDLASTIRSLSRSGYVAASIVYKLQGSRTEDFGLLTSSGTRKPAFNALARAFATPLASPGSVSLSLRQSHGSVIASGTAPPGDFLRLEALQGGALRYYALFTLDRFNRFSIRLPSVLGANGLTVRVFRYWEGRTDATSASV